jgi:hypothetical protein
VGFKVGDIVTWEFQSLGHYRRKKGTVIAVIKPNEHPSTFIRLSFGKYVCRSNGGYGAPRDHESYLVQVGKSMRLYWPVVSNLQKA